MTRIISFIFFVAVALTAASQNIGDISYRVSYGGGGGIEKICYNQWGEFYGGETLEKLPVGTIVEAKYMGRGYYSAKPLGSENEGILYGTENVKKEWADPQLAIDIVCTYEKYTEQFPALGDKPIRTYYTWIERNPNPDEKLGDAIVQLRILNNPDTPEERRAEAVYYGKFLPYAVWITHKKQGSEIKELKKPFAVYSNVDILGGFYGLTIGDTSYMKY